MMNITFPANEELTDIIHDWGRELEFRLQNFGIEYDRQRDLLAAREGDYIVVFANPILNKDMEIEGEEFIPRYNVEAHIITPPKQPDWWTDGGMYKWDSPATMTYLVPRIIIHIPYLVIILNEDGNLFRDGKKEGVTDFMQERVNQEQDRIGRKIIESLMSNFDKGMSV